MKKLFLLLLITPFILLMGCQTNSSHPSKNNIVKKFPPVLSDSVIILRSSIPTWKYEEMGKVSDFFFNGDINYIFKEMQKKAGSFGANGIVNFDITATVDTFTTFKTVRGAGGAIFIVPSTNSTTRFQATGMLIHKTEENK